MYDAELLTRSNLTASADVLGGLPVGAVIVTLYVVPELSVYWPRSFHLPPFSV